MKAILIALLISFIFFFSPTTISAHPVDTSNLLIYLETNVSEKKIEPNKFEGILTFNWLQLSALTKENDNPVEIYKRIGKFDSMFADLINSNISFESSNNKCNFKLNRYNSDDINMVLNLGVRYEILGECKENIKDFNISNTVFENTISTQSNIVQLFRSNKLVAQNDKGELKYSSNPNVSDTELKDESFKDKVNKYFNDLIKSDNSWTIPLIFLTIYLMGALHSLEGGHNKIILGSLIIDKKIDFKQSILFTIIFTLTHMSDIILLSIGLLFLNKYVDLYRLLPDITIFSIVALIGIASFSLIKELKHILEHKFGHNHEHDHEHSHDELPKKDIKIGNSLLLAFISGLAPCLTGWSIFMLLFSTERVNLILPGMLFFGLGVFTVLMIFTTILHRSKTVILGKIGWISEYSSLISFTLVLISAIIQLISTI
jgi:ABC-type nickel/cobalt efflux system permease component RcnA